MQDGERAYKMLLSATDRTTLKAIIDGKTPLPEDHSVRIAASFTLFQKLLEGADLNQVCMGLSRILVVDISLDRGHDNPQLIFESLNSTGKELGQADLIRNYVLMGLEPGVQARLYREHWRPMELAFGQIAYANQFDSFMRHYLTLKTGEIPNVEDVYEAFKRYAVAQGTHGDDIAMLVSDIHRHAGFFCRISLGAEPDMALDAAFQDIRELRAEVTFPFLLELYGDYAAQILPREDFLAALRLVEAYIFRRIVCAIPTNSHNKTFSTFGRALRKDRYLDSVKAHFLTLPSYRRFPDDREFRQEMERRHLYSFRNRSYWLRRLENHGRRERVAVEEYTIEHILPQNENLSDDWKADLGPTWQWVRDTYLHTLGNLTLTAFNASMSDKPFRAKRDDPKGFRFSPLHLNAGLASVDVWDEVAIKTRAQRLSGMAVAAWCAPHISEATLESFKRKADSEVPEYSIMDHPSLVTGSLKPMFEALRHEIKALNPAIVEEFGKLYVSYSAERVFVSAIPRQARLRLVLNMPFPELQDARKMGRDITNIGHWSKGDVDVDLERASDTPYVIGLVRQAFEWQMDEVASG